MKILSPAGSYESMVAAVKPVRTPFIWDSIPLTPEQAPKILPKKA